MVFLYCFGVIVLGIALAPGANWELGEVVAQFERSSGFRRRVHDLRESFVVNDNSSQVVELQPPPKGEIPISSPKPPLTALEFRTLIATALVVHGLLLFGLVTLA